MHEALIGLLERAELAVAACRGLVPDEDIEGPAGVVAAARIRLEYPEEVTVAVLAGGTGSGKSSVFNALLGEEHARVGPTRPVTSAPLAGVPSRHAWAMAGFLDGLGVDTRVEQDRLPGVCLLDLPDTDSVETEHRHRVEEVMPKVDVMVWVVDPEKYRDAALHHRYLVPLGPYRRQLLMCLNQVDRLSPDSAERVRNDLVEALSEDGLDGVPVIVTAAAPAAGPPLGLEELADALLGMGQDRPALYGKLIADLAEVAKSLESMIGPAGGFRSRSEEAAESARRSLTDGDVSGAANVLLEFAETVAVGLPEPAAERVRQIAAAFPEHVQELAAAVERAPGSRGWWRRRRPAQHPRPEVAPEAVAGVIGPITELMADRARARAAIAELAVAARTVAARQGPVT